MRDANPDRCATCGAENDTGAAFCTVCGRYLLWDDQESPPPRTFAAQPQPAVEPEKVAPESRSVAESTPKSESGDKSTVDISQAIETSRSLAKKQGRGDIAKHLDEAEQRMATTPVPVVVCGEFKSGKSSLINALLLREVCPVDADLVTAIPTLVKYTPETEPYLATVSADADGESVRQPFDPDQLRALVTEQADPKESARERLVEVGIKQRMLASGLCLVDTPGVGGLDSAHGFLTLGALTRAKGLLFLTDAAQELTAPELSFLQTALERCPGAALVVSKVDLYPHWRRIVDLNRGHLQRAGIDLPIIAVSSIVRSMASGQAAAVAAELNAESGFRDLVTFLARDVVARIRAEAARTAAHEVEFVAGLMQQRTDAERVVLAAPEKGAELVAALSATEAKAGDLARSTATWQEVLRDGLEDLWSDVLDDLERQLGTVRKETDQIIEQGDPKQTWTDTEAWIRRQVAMVAVQNRELLTGRAAVLAAEVAAQFDMQADASLRIKIADVDGGLESITLAPASSLSMPGGRLAPLVLAARVSVSIPMVAGSVAAAVLGAWPAVTIAIAGVGIGLGAGVGHKIIRDERLRQQTYRQQQAKGAVHQFLLDVRSRLNKQTQDALRATQRQLRDEFQARAVLIQQSATDSARAASRASRLEEPDQRRRLRELETEHRRLGAVRAAARELVGARG